MRIRRMNRLYAYQGNVPRTGTMGEIKRQYNKRAAAIVSLALVASLIVACGPTPAILRTGIAAVQPAVEYAISKGLIGRDRAQLYRDDATKLLNGYDVLSATWNAASTKAGKLLAVQAFANSTLAPIASDFTQVPQLAEAMLILNTTIAVLEAFLGGATNAPGAAANVPRNDKELAEYLKVQNARLKAALGHQRRSSECACRTVATLFSLLTPAASG